MLNNLRLILEPYLIKLGSFFSKFGLSPNFWTFLGLIIAIFSAIAFSLGSSFHESLDSQNLYYPIIGGFCSKYNHKGIILAAAADGCGTKIELSNKYN